MTDQPSTSDDDYEETNWDDPQSLRWSRPDDPNWPPDWPKTIPLDWIYDPETESYSPPGEPCMFDVEEFMRRLEKTIEEARRQPPIPPEQLRAAGVLSKPSSRRKSRGGKRDCGRSLFPDDDSLADEQPTPSAPDADRSDPN